MKCFCVKIHIYIRIVIPTEASGNTVFVPESIEENPDVRFSYIA